MKKIFTIGAILFLTSAGRSQENYRDFETTPPKAFLGERNGALDSLAANTMTNAINMSSVCAKYIRSAEQYDNLKLYFPNKLVDVTPYATIAGTPPKITMKVYTSAPAGTR